MLLIMHQYPRISLNILNKKCLNKLLWLCQGSGYAWSSYMVGRFSKMPRVLNMLGFWIWQGCICKDYTDFWICPNMTQYATIMPEYDSICLEVPQYAWTCLNIGLSMLSIPEYAWKCLNKLTTSWFSLCLIILHIWQGFKYASDIKYAWVSNMLLFSYNNIIIIIIIITIIIIIIIIIVTNIVILEYLPA